MITLYVSSSCTSCRKARAWLKVHNIPFNERNILTQPLDKAELTALLNLTENGTEDLISFRSKGFQTLEVDVEDLSMLQLLQLMEMHPSLIRRPIIFDDKILQIGFQAEEMRHFLPRKERKVKLRKAQMVAEMYHRDSWDTAHENELVR